MDASFSVGRGHEATDTQLPIAPLSQATGHCSSMFCSSIVHVYSKGIICARRTHCG